MHVGCNKYMLQEPMLTSIIRFGIERFLFEILLSQESLHTRHLHSAFCESRWKICTYLYLMEKVHN